MSDVTSTPGAAKRAGEVIIRGTAALRRFVAPAVDVARTIAWPLVRPVARAAGRYLSIVSAFGWIVLAAAVVAWIVGRSLGWKELTVIAVVAFAALVLAVAFVIGRSAYAITLDLANSRVVVGERAVGRVDVRNTSTRALLPARIELPVGAGLAYFELPRLAPGASHDDLFTIPTNLRAVLSVGPLRSVRGDPFGLLRRQVAWTEPVDLFVHPRTVNLDNSSSGFLRDLEGLPTKDLSSDDVSFHALREYRPGDDRRNVHWKSSARTGTLMVKQFEETRRSHLAVALSTRSGDYGDADAFELAVSTCGSLGLQALREDKDLSVLVQGAALSATSGKRLLDGLSAVTLVDARDDIVALASEVSRAVPNASVVILLVGGPVSAAELRAASTKLALGVRVVVVACDPLAEVSRRVIGDLVVLTIAELSDLPRAMTRVSA